MNGTYVDAPKFLDTVKADDLFEQLVPVLLAAWRLGEPQSPSVLQLMLDIEVRRVIKDSHDLTVRTGSIICRAVGGVCHCTVWRNGNRIKWYGLLWFRDVGHFKWLVAGSECCWRSGCNADVLDESARPRVLYGRR